MPKSVPTQFEEAFAAAAVDDSMCVVGRLIAEHEAGGVIRAKVDDSIHYSAATISRVLKQFSITLSHEAINKHRKGACRCLPDKAGV